MASAQGIRAGRAFVELFADDSKLVRGLRAAEKKLKAFGDSVRNLGLKMVGVGSAILAPLTASAKLFSSYGDSVAKMARRTGLSVEALSELQFVAGQSGVEVAELESGLQRMQRTIHAAQTGSKGAVDALAALGLTAEKLAELTPEEQFKVLAEAISRVEDPTSRAAQAMQVFGRSGARLLPMFASGAAGIEALQAEARRLGLTMSGEDAQAAEDLTDALDRLWKVLRMGVFRVGAAVAPIMKTIAEQVTRVATVISAWIAANRQVIVTVLQVAAAVVAAGIALMVLGTAISGLAAMIGVAITVATTIASVLGTLAAAVAFLVSPIGLVIAAVVALGAYLAYTTGAGGQTLAWLGDRFGTLKDDAVSSYQGIADALAAGDISLAVKVLWLTLKMEWTRGTNFLEKAWLNFRNFFIRVGYDAWHGLLAVAETVWHALEVGWIETTAFFSKLWTDFTSFFAKTWENIKAGAQKAWNWIKSLFDSSIDLQTENRLVEDQKQAAISRIENEGQRKVAEREARRQAERQRAAAIHDATLGELGRANLDKHRALDAEYADRMASAEADLNRARQEWREALETARQKRQDKEAAGPGLEGPDDIINKARDALARLGDVGDLVQQEAAKVGVRGTFNATAIQGLAAGSAADRTAQATEETAKGVKELRQDVRNNRATFT